MKEFNDSINQRYELLSPLAQTVVVSGVIVTAMLFTTLGFIVSVAFIGSRLFYHISK